jgi:hypothetical protein
MQMELALYKNAVKKVQHIVNMAGAWKVGCSCKDRFGQIIDAVYGFPLVRKDEELMGEDKVVRCAFCGEAYPEGTPTSKHDNLVAHIKVCQLHPMRDIEEYCERMLKGLLWYIDITESGTRPPEHSCGFFDDPESGYCKDHEAWADAITATERYLAGPGADACKEGDRGIPVGGKFRRENVIIDEWSSDEELAWQDGYHARQQDLAFIAFQRGKLDRYNDAIGDASDAKKCQERIDKSGTERFEEPL